ncbi:MAG: PIN domain-containing protein [Thaumarchaeota archaeon]|nr:PIN domain-containing protein [Nitrososphaerota archaeon]
MVESNIQSKKQYTLDTCVLINMYKYPNIVDLLKHKIDLANSEVHLCTRVLIECTKKGIGAGTIFKMIHRAGAQPKYGNITGKMYREAIPLELKYSKLHTSDSHILAYASATETVLVTCDQGLGDAAESAGTCIINPDYLSHPAGDINPKSEFVKKFKKMAGKPAGTARKSKYILKPGHKIVWSTFN